MIAKHKYLLVRDIYEYQTISLSFLVLTILQDVHVTIDGSADDVATDNARTFNGDTTDKHGADECRPVNPARPQAGAVAAYRQIL